ncbi:winged helix-turn-helix transcriptional regulator [Candidatus Woesearchaeota archaeon]|nr:winged helix-turn-helix transcriptional regulator [Candidatus Woesearchaeota archaeon]
MARYTLLAPVGMNMDNLYPALHEFLIAKVILIAPRANLSLAERTKADLTKFSIPVHVKPIDGNLWEELFRVITEIAQFEKPESLLVNVATGDANMQCAATSAAFVNGIKACSVENNQVMLLPVLKFSYYTQLTEKKMGILEELYHGDRLFDHLCRRLRMSSPLLSYHLNGNLKSSGLKQHGLVETKEEKGKVTVSLTMLGKLLVKGYIR